MKNNESCKGCFLDKQHRIPIFNKKNMENKKLTRVDSYGCLWTDDET